MIKKITANKNTFRPVEFNPGFNVILAEKTEKSTKKDSRNGLGKSTLVEIIHFLYGSNLSKSHPLKAEELMDWEFSMLVDYQDKEIQVSRSLNKSNRIFVYGDLAGLQYGSLQLSTDQVLPVNGWTEFLGKNLFDIDIEILSETYKPSFRSLFNYFSRKGKDAYSTPFEFFRKQKSYDVQINTTFLLGLNWQFASQLQDIKDQQNEINTFYKSVKKGIMNEVFHSKGKLETERMVVARKVKSLEKDISSFIIHPQYDSLVKDADNLSLQIHALVNERSMKNRLLDLYTQSIVDETDEIIDAKAVETMFSQIGIELPGISIRKLSEVSEFHRTVLNNREEFLSSEMNELRTQINMLSQQIVELDIERAELFEILESHGALGDLKLLQKKYIELSNQLSDIDGLLSRYNQIEDEESNLNIAKEQWMISARRDFDERYQIRENCVDIFNSYSEELYNAPGNLILDIDSNGFKFDVEIERSGSNGINNMKIFCYDLMLATIWAQKEKGPKLLIHDSIIFDGVDERQVALALELAYKMSEKYGFQYICTMNSDAIPYNEFSESFYFDDHVCHKLSDTSITGSLLGIQF